MKECDGEPGENDEEKEKEGLGEIEEGTMLGEEIEGLKTELVQKELEGTKETMTEKQRKWLRKGKMES